MNIYALIPLIATIAYIPLLITVATSQPRQKEDKQHKLFLLFLVAASLWSLADIIFRCNIFPQHSYLLLQIIVFLFVLMAVQFHCFSSSFFPKNKSSG